MNRDGGLWGHIQGNCLTILLFSFPSKDINFRDPRHLDIGFRLQKKRKKKDKEKKIIKGKKEGSKKFGTSYCRSGLTASVKYPLGSRTFQVLSNFTRTISLNCTVMECQCFHLAWWSEKVGKLQIGLNSTSLAFIQFLKFMESCSVLFAHAPYLMCSSPILQSLYLVTFFFLQLSAQLWIPWEKSLPITWFC